MNRFLPMMAAALVAAFGGVVILGAAPQAQEESKTDKVIKSLTEKVEKLEKRVAELERKLAEKDPVAKIEDRLKGWLDKFGLEGGAEGLKEKLDEFRRSMPEMPELPDFESMPDLFQGADMEQLFDMLRSQLEGQMPEFFDGLDMEGLFDKLKEKFENPEKSDPKKKGSKRRSISL